MSEQRSAFIIGGGTAGLAAARTLAAADWKVTVAEPDKLGGTCLWRGCVPKKALYQSARALRLSERLSNWGVDCGDRHSDWQGALAWKWHAQETYADDQAALLAARGVELVEESARFTSPDSVVAGGREHRADAFVIATGSAPTTPVGVSGLELADTSDDVLRWTGLPGSAVIVGGGFVAMELAGILASWGVRITMVVRSARPLAGFDEQLVEAAVRRLSALRVEFATQCELVAIAGAPGSLTAAVRRADGTEVAIGGERVILAIGRHPELADLGLEAAGVQTESHRVVHDAYLRTTNPNVWVAGDAAGGMMQTPIANLEGRTVGQSIASGRPEAPDCSCSPIAVFTIPQLATVGMTEQQARDDGRQVLVSQVSLGTVAQAIIEDERDGFVRLVADKSDHRILGGQIAAPNAADLIYPVAIAMKAGWTLEDLGRVPAVHPSLAEAVYFASR